MKLSEVLIDHGFLCSLAEGRRLAFKKAIKLNGEPVTDINAEVKTGDEITVGKKIRLLVVNPQDE